MQQFPMSTLRKTSLVAGIFYLITFVSVPTLTLYSPLHDAHYIVAPGTDTGAIVGVILEMIVALAGIATAVVLYPVLKKQNEAAALGLVGSRILEAGTIFAGVACILTIVTLRQQGIGADGLVTGHALITLYDRIFLIGQSFLPAVDDLLLGFLLFKSRLVPRGLSLIGILGGVILIGGDVAVLLGFLEVRTPAAASTAMPVAVFELTLGVWLVVKGLGERLSPPKR
jgi:hypothetical protein